MKSTQCSKVSVDLKDLNTNFLVYMLKNNQKKSDKLLEECDLIDSELQRRNGLV